MELGYAQPSSRPLGLLVQALLWLVVLVAASRFAVPALRPAARDETLIDLDAERGTGDRTGFGGWVDELLAEEEEPS